MSHRFLTHAKEELVAGRRLQASEKIWGAVAQGLKAIGEQRGWDHSTHQRLRDISKQLRKEYHHGNRYRFQFTMADHMHGNFYGNEYDSEEIELALQDAEKFVATLDQLRESPHRPFRIQGEADQRRVGRLLGIPEARLDEELPIGNASDSQGFSKVDAQGIPRNPIDNGGPGGSGGVPVKPQPPDKPGPGTGPRGSGQPQNDTPLNGSPKDSAPHLGGRPTPTVKQPKPATAVNVKVDAPKSLAGRRPAPSRQPKPVYPKMSTDREKATQPVPRWFKPPRLPGQRR